MVSLDSVKFQGRQATEHEAITGAGIRSGINKTKSKKIRLR